MAKKYYRVGIENPEEEIVWEYSESYKRKTDAERAIRTNFSERGKRARNKAVVVMHIEP